MEKVQIGDATLYCGDCREVLPTLAKVDAVITDPPYGIGYAANPIVGKGKKKSNHERKEWDNATAADIHSLRNMGDIQIIWGGNYYDLPPTRCWLSWFKPDSPPSMADFELAWTNMNKNAQQIAHSIAATNRERVGHPTQKPLPVMRWCIERAGKPVSVLDPFMGSGTTGVACAQLGSKFVGIELDRRYFDIACTRIEQAYSQGLLFTANDNHKPKTADLL